MKKYLALILTFSMLLCSCKKGDESSTKDEIDVNTTIKVITTSPPETTTTTTTSTNNDYIIDNTPVPGFIIQKTFHNTIGRLELIYEGLLSEFDYSMLNGYVLLGQTYDCGYKSIKNSFSSTDFDDGVPILYSEEKTVIYFGVKQTTYRLLFTNTFAKKTVVMK